MQIDLRKSLHLHNKYEFELVDSRTGRLKQKAYAENVVLNQVWQLLADDTSSAGPLMYAHIGFGTGTGTPAATDTGLFTSKFTYRGTFTLVERIEEFPNCSYTFSIQIPASADYTGNLTEVGLLGAPDGAHNPRKVYWTHAMLTDAEGNPIVVEKTDLDILTATFTIYVTFGEAPSGFYWYKPGAHNTFCRAFRQTDAAPYWDEFYHRCYIKQNIKHCSTIMLNNGYLQAATVGATVGDGVSPNTSTRLLSIPTTRLAADSGNTKFYNGMLIGHVYASDPTYIGGIIYPNSAVFPEYTIEGMRIGTGDGVTKTFNVPIETFITDTGIVKINGTVQEEDSYSLDEHNPASQTGNVSVSNFLDCVQRRGWSDLNATGKAIFSNYVNDEGYNTTIGDSNRPLIYHVTDQCPKKTIQRIVANNLCLTVNYASGSTRTCMYPKFYETRSNVQMPLLIGTMEEVIRTIAAHPNDYTKISTPGTLIVKLSSPNIRVTQRADYPVYYFKWRDSELSTTQYLVWLTEGNVNPYANAVISGNFTWPTKSTITVDGTTWSYGTMVCANSNIVDGAHYCTMVWSGDLHTIFAGCYFKVSGGASQNGPWTTLVSKPLDTLVSVSGASSGYTYYGLASIAEDVTEAAYDYYKVEIDTSGATNIELQDATTQVYAAGITSASYLEYNGKKLVFDEPPAAGAVITLDATIDRPFKNENFVIDASMQIQFGGA